MRVSIRKYRKSILKFLGTTVNLQFSVVICMVSLITMVSAAQLIDYGEKYTEPGDPTDEPAYEVEGADTSQAPAPSDQPATPPPQSIPGILTPKSPGGLSTALAVKPFLFGIGPQADSAENQRLSREAPIRILTSWYNGPNDLGFMRNWQNSRIPNAYAKGYSLHLVVWSDKPETNLTTAYGPACGRAYPLSERFATDMQELATIYRGSGTLYVSMFTELQTFPCQDNTWKGSENYYRALMDQYRLARSIFKTHAPNSQISLTWGGWQASWDDPGNGSGRSLIPYFAEVMHTSDFQSFQAMDSHSNVDDITTMSGLLHRYGDGRVMVAHYKPDNASQTTWQKDLEQLFTPAKVESLRSNGIFAFNFMDGHNVNANETAYQQAKNIVVTYGK